MSLPFRCIVWALVFQLLCVAYLPALRGPFIYDDIEAILANPDLRFPLEPWRLLRDHEGSLQFDRRPVAGLVTLVDFQLWGFNASGYRLTNLLIHWMTGMAIAALASRVASGQGKRFPLLYGHILALVWLLHPLATSTVSFVFQRSEMLMSLFFVLSIYCLLRSGAGHRATLWMILSLGCAFLSGISKETGLTVVLAIPLFGRICLFGSWGSMAKQRWIYLLSLILGCAAITLWVMSGVRFAELHQPDTLLNTSRGYFMSQAQVITHYLKLVIFPHPLSFLPRFDPVPSISQFLPHFLGLLAIFVVLLVKGVKQRWIWLCMGGFLIILAPTSSFIPIPLEPEAEFRMYLPLAFVLAGGVAWIGGKLLTFRAAPLVVAIAVTGLLLAEFMTSLARNRVYGSALTVWEDTVVKAPANPKSWINLAFTYLDHGKPREAMACADHLRRAGDGSRRQIAAITQISASALLDLGEASKARALLESLPEQRPVVPGIQVSYARTLAATGEAGRALEVLRAQFPDPFLCHPSITRLYGSVYQALGRDADRDRIAAHLSKIQPGVPIPVISVISTGNPEKSEAVEKEPNR